MIATDTSRFTEVAAGNDADGIALHWMEIQDRLKARWDRLTDEDLPPRGGSTASLAARLQERYGITSAEANLQVEEFGLDELAATHPAI